MIAKDLIEILQQVAPGTLVVLSKDAEGNSLSPLYGTDRGWYEPENTYEGQFATHQVTGSEPCIVLWPVN